MNDNEIQISPQEDQVPPFWVQYQKAYRMHMYLTTNNSSVRYKRYKIINITDNDLYLLIICYLLFNFMSSFNLKLAIKFWIVNLLLLYLYDMKGKKKDFYANYTNNPSVGGRLLISFSYLCLNITKSESILAFKKKLVEWMHNHKT